MANFAQLKAAIQQAVDWDNHNNEISGLDMLGILNTMINSLGAGYMFAGVAKLTPTQTDPGTPDQNVFYIAAEQGTYTNFPISGGYLQVAENEVAIFKYNGQWSKETTGAASLEKVNQLGQQVDGLGQEKVDISTGINLLNPLDDKVSLAHYLNSSGSLTSNTDYNVSGFISVEPGQSYAASKSNNFRYVNFYNDAKEHISNTQLSLQTIFTVPSGVAYIRLTIAVSQWEYAFITKGTQRADFVQYSPIAGYYAKPLNKSVTDESLNSETINTIVEKLAGLVVAKGANMFNAGTMIVPGQYVANDGQIRNGAGWSRSDYIEIVGGNKYVITAATIARSVGLSWFDSSKQLISGGAQNIFDTVLTAPENAKYLVFNVGVDNVVSTKIMMVEGESAQPYESQYVIPIESVAGLQTAFDKIGNKTLTFKRNSIAGTFVFQSQKGSISFVNRPASHSDNVMLNFSGWSILGRHKSNNDDVAPVHILNMTIGANHGLPCAKVYLPSHGFDNTIIGTEWSHTDGKKYYPALIIDTDYILFMSENAGTSASPIFNVMGTGTLTYDGNQYVIGSTPDVQYLFPSIADYAQSVKIDDETNNNDGEFRCSTVQLVESYEIINPASVLINLIARAGQSSEPSFDGTKVARVENIYQIDGDLNVFVISNFVVLDSIAFQDVMFSQAIGIANSGVKYYVPNSLPWGSVDLRTPQEVAWSSSIPHISTNAEHTKDTTKPITRVLQYLGNLGFAIGFVPGFGVAADLFANTSETFEIRNNTGKIYPHGANSVIHGATLENGDMFSAVLYRCFFDSTTTTNRQSVYHFDLNGIEYVFVDYKGSMIDNVNLEKASLNGKKIEIIESQNTELKTNVYNDGFYINATYVANETCYLIAKIS